MTLISRLLGQSLSWGLAVKNPCLVSTGYVNCPNVIRPVGSNGGACVRGAKKGALKSGKSGSTRQREAGKNRDTEKRNKQP